MNFRKTLDKYVMKPTLCLGLIGSFAGKPLFAQSNNTLSEGQVVQYVVDELGTKDLLKREKETDNKVYGITMDYPEGLTINNRSLNEIMFATDFMANPRNPYREYVDVIFNRSYLYETLEKAINSPEADYTKEIADKNKGEVSIFEIDLTNRDFTRLYDLSKNPLVDLTGEYQFAPVK